MKIQTGLLSLILIFSSNLLASPVLQIDYRGASITRGVGASAPLGNRINAHLSRQSQVERIAAVKTLLALDYFYPTNFELLRRGTDEQFRTRVRTLLNEWSSQYEVVVIGLLPVSVELNPDLRNFIASERGAPFRGAFQVLGYCCSTRARALNDMLRSEAARNPRVVLFDWTTAIAAYQQRPDLSPTPTQIYSDMLHINDRGQVMLFNLALRSVLGRIWDVSLTAMPLN